MVTAPINRSADQDKAPSHLLPHKYNVVEADGDALAALIEEACNDLSASGYDVVSVQLTTAGRYGDPNSGVAAGYSYTNGALIVGRKD